MKRVRMFWISLVLFFLILWIFYQPVAAISYLQVLVGEVESDTLVQGVAYSLEMDCTPMDSVFFHMVPDLNGNGLIDAGETTVLQGDVSVVDNGPPGEGVPFFDSDPTEGLIVINVFIYFSPGEWILCFVEGSDSASASVHFVPPDPLERSVSGRLILEGISPPDPALDGIAMLGGSMDPPVMMYFLTDSMGDFSFNWPGEATTIVVMVMVAGFDTTIYVDGHITGFDIFFPGEPVDGLRNLRIYVEGVESDTQVQGQMYSFKMECYPLDTIYMQMIPDLNNNGLIDPGEYSVLPPDAIIADNGEPDIVTDSDTLAGVIDIPMAVNFAPGDWIVGFSDDEETVTQPFHVLAPEPLLYSVAGQLTIEGITPPNPTLAMQPILAGGLYPMLLMYFLPDSMGDFSFNWPGSPTTLTLMVIAEDYDTFVYVDGHITGFEIFIGSEPMGLSYFEIYVEGEPGYTQIQGQEYAFEMDCMPMNYVDIEIYADLDSNGIIDGTDYSLFGIPWTVFDNGSYDLIYDSEGAEGLIYVEMPFNLPPGHYVIMATEDDETIYTSFTVRDPEPLTMSVSGRVTLEDVAPPDSRLASLVIGAEGASSYQIYLGACDDMGDYSINWSEGAEDVFVMFYEPFLSPDWDFGSIHLPVYVDGLETGIDVFIPLLTYEDSIRINFSYDPLGYWEVYPHEIQATYRDTLGVIVDEIELSDVEPIYIPVKPYLSGVYFEGVDHEHFPQHNFISPVDTYWVSPEAYPEAIDIYVNQTHYHFMVILEGMDIDSVPVEGIPTYLYGTDSLGHSYYVEHTLFVDYYAEEYVVGGEHEVCDADWRYVLPPTLPHNYIPEVIETTFTIEEVPDWPWLLIRMPVRYTTITENNLPECIDLNLYPNPFNQATTINFDIKTPTHAALTVYNIKGELITTLLDKELTSGAYHIKWDGMDSMASGIYFISLETENRLEISKGLFLK